MSYLFETEQEFDAYARPPRKVPTRLPVHPIQKDHIDKIEAETIKANKPKLTSGAFTTEEIQGKLTGFCMCYPTIRCLCSPLRFNWQRAR